MPLPKHLSAYLDIKQVFDSAIAGASDVTLTFASTSAALRWRQRAYTYRKLLREARSKSPLAETPYDNLLIRLVPGEPKMMRLELNSAEKSVTSITFDNPDAALLPFASLPPTEVEDDPLLLSAESILRKLNL
jgi:hypothetical protein